MSVPAATVPRTTHPNDAAVWATSAGNKFREVAGTTENPNTKLLAEGLTYLAGAIRALGPSVADQEQRLHLDFLSIYAGVVTTSPQPRTLLPPKEQRNFADLVEALGSSSVSVCDGAGRSIPLPPELQEAFHNVALAMSRGKGIQLVPHHMTLTTQEAADILNISRPTFVKLLEEERIPYEKPGRHRRVRLDALLKYQEDTRVQRRKALREATRDSADEVRALLGRKD